MNFFSRLLTHHGIKLIVLAKIGVLIYMLIDQRWIYFGELELGANADRAPLAERSGDNRRARVQTGTSMDDLLNLPSINPERLRKEEISRYLALIDRQRSQLEDRIRTLEQRQEQMRQLESSIDQKLRRLEEEIQYFKQTQQQEKSLQDERLAKLVDFYERMNPKRAAPVFERLDRDLVVQLFQRIPQKQTTEILSLMDPQRSVELSEYFGRIRSAKEYELLKEINVSLLKEFEACKTE